MILSDGEIWVKSNTVRGLSFLTVREIAALTGLGLATVHCCLLRLQIVGRIERVGQKHKRFSWLVAYIHIISLIFNYSVVGKDAITDVHFITDVSKTD